jgi:NAD+ kinase
VGASNITTEGDHIKVTASKFPFPTVCADKQSTDWFHSISRTLRWNEREKQKSFVVVEEDEKPVKSKPKRGDSAPDLARRATTDIMDDKAKAEDGLRLMAEDKAKAEAEVNGDAEKKRESDSEGDEEEEEEDEDEEDEEEDAFDIDE